MARTREQAAAEGRELTDTQRRLLTAALEVFSEKGYAGASTAAIAARAGVAEKTLFAQFGSKSRLLERTLRPSVFTLVEPRAFERVRDVVTPGRSLEDVLGALVADRVKLARDHRKKLKLVAHEAILRPRLLEAFRAAFRERLAPAVAATVADLAARGELRTDLPPRTLVRTVVSVTIGYALSRFVLGLEPDGDDDAEIARITKVLVEGLRPRTQPRRTKANARRAPSGRAPRRS